MLYSPTAETSDPRHSLEELYHDRKLYTFRAGEFIPMEPQEIWLVCRGVVQLSVYHASGDQVLLGLAGPSMPFGLPFSALDSYYAMALTPVDLLRLSLADIEASPILAQGLFQHLGRRLRQTEAILATSNYRRVEDRLRHLLFLLKYEVGQPTINGTRIGVKLTHQQLASAIGTSRVTVTRLLGKLRQQQWIQFDHSRHIVVMANATLY
jgi:CRP-like cAMP-binding protein